MVISTSYMSCLDDSKFPYGQSQIQRKPKNALYEKENEKHLAYKAKEIGLDLLCVTFFYLLLNRCIETYFKCQGVPIFIPNRSSLIYEAGSDIAGPE